MIMGYHKGTKMCQNKPEQPVFLNWIILLRAITEGVKSRNFLKWKNSLYNYPKIRKRKTITCKKR